MQDQAPYCTAHMARQLVAMCSIVGKIAVGCTTSLLVPIHSAPRRMRLQRHGTLGGKKCHQEQIIQRATWRSQLAAGG